MYKQRGRATSSTYISYGPSRELSYISRANIIEKVAWKYE